MMGGWRGGCISYALTASDCSSRESVTSFSTVTFLRVSNPFPVQTTRFNLLFHVSLLTSLILSVAWTFWVSLLAETLIKLNQFCLSLRLLFFFVDEYNIILLSRFINNLSSFFSSCGRFVRRLSVLCWTLISVSWLAGSEWNIHIFSFFSWVIGLCCSDFFRISCCIYWTGIWDFIFGRTIKRFWRNGTNGILQMMAKWQS